LSGSSASPASPATIDIAAVSAPYSNTVVAGDIEGDAFPSATLSFIEDGEQGWTVYVTSVDEDKVLRAAISDPSEGEIAGAAHADTVITDTVITHNNPTIAGDFVVGSTVTGSYDSGPDEVKWQSAPWNGGSPDTWTDIGGATAGSYLITGDMTIKSLRIAVRYGADWLYSAFSLPVEGYWPLTGATPGTQIEALTGIHAGLVTSGTDEAKLVVKAQSGSSPGPWFGLSSAASASHATAFDSGNSDQNFFFRLGPQLRRELCHGQRARHRPRRRRILFLQRPDRDDRLQGHEVTQRCQCRCLHLPGGRTRHRQGELRRPDLDHRRPAFCRDRDDRLFRHLYVADPRRRARHLILRRSGRL
jgi:hypothetical protein